MKYLTVIALLFMSSLVSANNSLPENRHIAVVGTAELQAKPDIAVVHLDVHSVKTTSVEAKAEVDKRVNRLIEGLSDFNVAQDNVSASSISTAPYYSYGSHNKKVLEGYSARRSLKVTLKNIEHLNAFMDFALKSKINEIRNIELKSSKADALKDEVNALAVNNAKQKAASLAKAFDARLGRIYSINSSTNNSRYRYGANSDIEHIRLSNSVMGQPPEAGQYLQESIVFSASISVVFDLDVQ